MQNSPVPKPVYHRRTRSSFTPRNSSLQQVLAEDYFADDFAGETETYLDEPTVPPVALTPSSFSRSGLGDHGLRSTRDQQRSSLTALLPFRSRPNSQSPDRSQTTESVDVEFMPTLTGDKDGKIKVSDKTKGGLSSWFTGTSAPVQVGIPIVEQEAESSLKMSPRDPAPSAKLQKRPTLSTGDSQTPPKGPTTSRFGFFTPKTPVQQTVQIPAELNDAFLTLDITSALFPCGTPTERDPFSPSSFKNLLMNAEGLLLKLQTAYKIRTLSLHEISSEHEAQAEELEEAETRAKHLKMQLEDMAARVSAQEAAMAELQQTLMREKQARAQEKEAREKSIALVRSRTAQSSEAEEDLGISTAKTDRSKWRTSNGSTDMSESDDESGRSDSLFSRSLSPTLTCRSEDIIGTPEIMQGVFGRVVQIQHAEGVQRPKPVQQPSTFQKMLKGISGSESTQTQKSEDGCPNCRGQNSSVAWDAVSLLRAENKGLKERVGSLEIAVEGALDVCYGVNNPTAHSLPPLLSSLNPTPSWLTLRDMKLLMTPKPNKSPRPPRLHHRNRRNMKMPRALRHLFVEIWPAENVLFNSLIEGLFKTLETCGGTRQGSRDIAIRTAVEKIDATIKVADDGDLDFKGVWSGHCEKVV
ncbi:hypothetical protein B7494_g1922 [Chlorociboria aeruginascens]|nr:hypothetical protein B7494_g1922 [Chlorociboria aeruginascens]